MRKKGIKKILASVIAFCLVLSMMPWSSLVALAESTTGTETTSELDAAKAEAKEYIDGLMAENDPLTVVSKWKEEFSWDTEKRETNGKSYLFEWSYYNGVVFEGLDYVYDKTKDTTYSDYVEEYLSTMIKSDGSWAKCLNNSAKECAGYNSTHGADCYKTASLLLDYGYTNMAKTLYKDLQDAQSEYTSSDIGGNYYHTWSSKPDYAVWLDGLYMIQPFMAEYAAAKNDTTELNRIAGRFAWVSENMYDESTGLFYHMANSKDSEKPYYNNNDQYWGRAIGWYAAAMVDVMDNMSGDDLTSMKSQLKKLVDGMTPYQTDDGMWRQFVNDEKSEKKEEEKSVKETSVTALMAYAIQKAVNNGWLDSSYAQYSQKAFIGMCNYSLKDDGLHYICKKGGYSGYDDPTTVNEGKGVGPFIMAYAEMLNAKEYSDSTNSDNAGSEDQTTSEEVTDKNTGIAISNSGATSVTITDKSKDETVKTALKDIASNFVAYDISLEGYTEGTEATVSIPIPTGYDTDNLAVYYINNGNAEKVTSDNNGKVVDGNYVFTTTHFSTYALVEELAAEDDWQSLPGEEYYKKVQKMDAGSQYVITDTGGSYALKNSNNSGITRTSIKIVDASGNYSISNITDETIWYIDDSNHLYCIVNNKEYYLNASSSGPWWNTSYSLSLSTEASSAWTINGTNNVQLATKIDNWTTVYLIYNNGFSVSTSSGSVSLYSKHSSTGEEQARLTGTLSYDIVQGSSLTEADIKKAVKVQVRANSNETATEVAWTDVTTTWDKSLDTNTIGTYTMTVSYKGVTLGNITVTVKEKALDKTQPNWGLNPAESYPEYPADGAVRINKTATNGEFAFTETGVTKVELDVAGISVKKGVNVILVADISNSMSWNDSTYSYTDTAITEGSNQRLNASKAAAKTFVNSLLKDNDDGTKTKNTITLLAFAGIDGDYNTHSTASTNDDVYQVGNMAMTSITDAENAINTLEKAKTGGTNYDYAFQQAYEKAQALYEANGNEVHIVFMTDGVPTHYNGVYYKQRSNTDLTACMQYVDPTKEEKSSYTSTGYDRNGNDIDSTSTQNITVYYNDGTTATNNVTYNKGWSDYVTGNTNGWAEKVKDLDYVAKVYSIGFGMKNGSVTQGATDYMPTLTGKAGGNYYIPYSVTKTLLQNIASTSNDYYEAENKEELSALYDSLATKIRYAGTQANVTDNVKSDFDVQMAQFSTIKGSTEEANVFSPTIEVTAYDLVSKSEATDAKPTGTRTGESEVIEKVTFNANGTEAYSSLDDGKTNIMTTSDGVTKIKAVYFTYTKTADSTEKFVWNIGNITDKELALSYYAYLTGTMEGTRQEGVYDTNEDATLEYVDINGDYAKQVFPLPKVNWGGAVTTVEYYLANEKGEPVNRMGERIPFANRIIISEGTYYKFALGETKTVYGVASGVPNEYQMSNPEAYYTVKSEANGTGSLKINDTYTFTDIGTSNTMTSTQRVDTDTGSYSSTKVAFAVYSFKTQPSNPELISDKIVIDYGKEINVDVLKNDKDYLDKANCEAELVGFSKYNASTAGDDIANVQPSPGLATFDGDYGTFSIKNGNVSYQPNKVINEVEHVYAVIKVTNNNESGNYYYQYNILDIIPATMMYYETDFSSSAFTTVTTGSAWVKAMTTDNDVAADGPQNDGTIGVDQTYGYDSTYTNDKYLSNGSSYFVEGAGIKLNENSTAYTYTDFSFKGTGFDLISRTGANQGAIRVDIYTDSARTNLAKSVTVLNKSESSLELYQIPVVSVNDLDYGTYYVRIGVNAAYKNDKYPALDRGGEFYFDAIRVYDPLNASSSSTAADDQLAYDAYLTDSEADPQVTEVREQLIKNEQYDATSGVEGMTFVDRIVDTETNSHDVEVKTYETIGPNNEVYLQDGQAVAFKVSADKKPSSFDIGAKSANGETANLKVVAASSLDALKANKAVVSDVTGISTSTSLFYPVSDVANAFVQNKETGKYEAYVFITNTNTSENSILSITDIKVAYGNTNSSSDNTSDSSSDDAPAVASYFVEQEAVSFAAFCLENPEAIVPEEEPNYDIQSAEFTASSCSIFKKATMTVTTTTDVETLKVTNKNGKEMSIDATSTVSEEGMKVWTVKFKPGYIIGTQSFTVTGYGADGTEGASATASIKVKLF